MRRVTDPGPPESPGDDDIALVLHTSGTTSRPKLVPLRHRNLFASAGNIETTYGLAPSDVAFCVMPLFHIHWAHGFDDGDVPVRRPCCRVHRSLTP